MNRDRELRELAERQIEDYDTWEDTFQGHNALDTLAELAGYRIDWIAEPVKLVRL